MANAYILNQVPVGYGAAVSLIVEMLVNAGWAYKASGDGLSGYNATGKVFTGTSSGALGWNNSRAWARLTDPASAREIVIQHSAAGGMRFKYSRSAKFTGGSPSATVTPSATDERVLWGSGSDATPTMSAYFGAGTATGTVKYQGAAFGAAPYGFWMAASITPAGAMQSGMMMDPVESVPEDVDPYVWHMGTANAFAILLGSSGTLTSASFPTPGGTAEGLYCHMNAAATSFISVMAAAYSLGWVQAGAVNNTWTWGFAATGLAANPFNAKHDTLPIVYARSNVTSLTSLGIKGWSTLMRWTTVARVHFVDTLNSRAYICVGFVWLPWDGVTTPSN